jgi:hypothetical protein
MVGQRYRHQLMCQRISKMAISDHLIGLFDGLQLCEDLATGDELATWETRQAIAILNRELGREWDDPPEMTKREAKLRLQNLQMEKKLLKAGKKRKWKHGYPRRF